MLLTPLVSAIIPTFNRAWSLGRAVESVLAQAYRPLELIVVDDGSTDGTPGLLAPLAARGHILMISQPNRGVSAARNAGLAAARGSLIAFLDSDDEWLPGKLEAQVEFLKQNPDQALVQTQERWFRGGRRVNPGRRHRKLAGDIFIPSLSLCLISPSAVMLRRSLLDEVGLFDESLPAAEDYDLWLRVLARHPAGLIDRELVIRHGGRPDQLSARPALDRWRILALEKILKTELSPERRQAAEEELARKRAIYQAGRKKRSP
ncbi:MAG: glycosyltransferase [Candidatus Adiutrix sp.]|jgi:glycosyltransferase involved in cell wall biosynthesis|nr:glycosyltransferase [Candidatus Adiutrix sp.]